MQNKAIYFDLCLTRLHIYINCILNIILKYAYSNIAAMFYLYIISVTVYMCTCISEF